MPTHVLISSMKDEGPFVLEWLAHHLVVGFDRVIVATNDCTDGTDALLDALAAGGHVAHVPNVVGPGDVPQHAGYAAIRRAHDVDAADWLAILDADEFLVVHAGGHRVGDLSALAPPDVDVISLNALCFADAPEVNWRPGRVTALFPNRAPIRHKANTALKSLTRDPSRFRAAHNHCMVGLRPKGPLRVMDGGGAVRDLDGDVPLWQALRSRPAGPDGHRLAQYNHYNIKTWDSFMLRRARGRGAVASTTPGAERHTEAYFRERAKVGRPDRSVARYDAEVEALMALMLRDGAVARAQAACEAVQAERTRPFRR